eukprot:38213-Ditylum_brightwellii.AAC.1
MFKLGYVKCKQDLPEIIQKTIAVGISASIIKVKNSAAIVIYNAMDPKVPMKVMLVESSINEKTMA